MISNSRPNPSHPTGASIALLEQFDHKKATFTQNARRTHANLVSPTHSVWRGHSRRSEMICTAFNSQPNPGDHARRWCLQLCQSTCKGPYGKKTERTNVEAMCASAQTRGRAVMAKA